MHDRRPSRRTVLHGAVLAALVTAAGCGTREPTYAGELRLATGPQGAVFRVVGGAIVDALEQRLPDVTVTTVPSNASADNQRMLSDGDVDLGLSSLDAAVGAEGEPPRGITALGRIYDSLLHLVVLADSPIRALADVAGQRVSVGAAASGTAFTTRRLLEQAELDIDPVHLAQADSADALDAGEIDAAFSLTGVPTPAILELAERRPLRVVPLPEAAELLSEAFPGPYVPAAIPTTAYPRVSVADTVAIPNLLLAAPDLSDDAAYAVTGTLFSAAESIGANHPEAGQINVRTGIATGPVPLHPGAVRWFREQKR